MSSPVTLQLQSDKRRLEQDLDSLRREAREREQDQQELRREVQALR